MIAQSDIPQMTSKSVEIVPAVHHRGNRIFSAADRWPDFSVFLCPEGHLPMLSVTQTHPLLPLFPRRRFPRPTPGRVFAADHRSGSGFDVNRRHCYATRDREWSSGESRLRCLRRRGPRNMPARASPALPRERRGRRMHLVGSPRPMGCLSEIRIEKECLPCVTWQNIFA